MFGPTPQEKMPGDGDDLPERVAAPGESAASRMVCLSSPLQLSHRWKLRSRVFVRSVSPPPVALKRDALLTRVCVLQEWLDGGATAERGHDQEPNVGAVGWESCPRAADSEEMEVDENPCEGGVARARGGAASSEPSMRDAGAGDGDPGRRLGAIDPVEVEAALQLFCDMRGEGARAPWGAAHAMDADDEDAGAAGGGTDEATVEGCESSEDAAQRGTTRQVFLPDWKKFCAKAGKKVPTVVPTCVIDFPFADDGGLNLQGDNRLLERMYCFRDTEENSRVVLHVHTLLPWGERGTKTLQGRAAKVTSVNVRHAAKTTAFFEQEGGGLSVGIVPVLPKLKHQWRKLWNDGSGANLEWRWEDAQSRPLSEDRQQHATTSYAEVLPNPASDKLASASPNS